MIINIIATIIITITTVTYIVPLPFDRKIKHKRSTKKKKKPNKWRGLYNNRDC